MDDGSANDGFKLDGRFLVLERRVLDRWTASGTVSLRVGSDKLLVDVRQERLVEEVDQRLRADEVADFHHLLFGKLCRQVVVEHVVDRITGRQSAYVADESPVLLAVDAVRRVLVEEMAELFVGDADAPTEHHMMGHSVVAAVYQRRGRPDELSLRPRQTTVPSQRPDQLDQLARLDWMVCH